MPVCNIFHKFAGVWSVRLFVRKLYYKNSIMKFKTLAMVLMSVVASFAVASCEKSGKGKISLGSPLLEIPAGGGICTMEYTVEGFGSGWQLLAVTDAKWIHDFVCPEEGVLQFTADPYEYTGERTAEVMVSMGSVIERFTVRQSGMADVPSDLTADRLVGKWICFKDRWDLAKEGECLLLDADGYPAKDDEGNYVKRITLYDYCKTFADELNEHYAGEWHYTPEDVADDIHGGEEGFAYFEITEDRAEFNIVYDLGPEIGQIIVGIVGGGYTYHPDTATLVVKDDSEYNPTTWVLSLRSWSENEIEVAVDGEYPWALTDYSGAESYQFNCTTVYSARK